MIFFSLFSGYLNQLCSNSYGHTLRSWKISFHLLYNIQKNPTYQYYIYVYISFTRTRLSINSISLHDSQVITCIILQNYIIHTNETIYQLNQFTRLASDNLHHTTKLGRHDMTRNNANSNQFPPSVLSRLCMYAYGCNRNVYFAWLLAFYSFESTPLQTRLFL